MVCSFLRGGQTIIISIVCFYKELKVGLLIISYENPNVARVLGETAHKRNERVKELSDTLKEVRS